MKKIALLAFVLVLFSTTVFVGFIRPAVAEETIYIRADGSVEGTDKIISSDNFTYTFTDNIYDEIVVERGNIIIDGNGYTLLGTGTGNGFYLSGIDNVTIKNTTIKNYEYGIRLDSSSNNTISGNNITANNGQGIRGYSANNNTISGNNITANDDRAIWFEWSSYTSISGNKITNNRGGIYLAMSSNNSINGNNIVANIYELGISIWGSFYIGGSSYNSIVGNNITNNEDGISLLDSTYNNISENNVTANSRDGIVLYRSSHDSIFGNNVTANSRDGIYLYESSNNTISKNSITVNNWGIYFYTSCYNNTIYHNNFINNTNQVGYPGSVNVWDDGYPSGGNYWSDYTGVDANGDGIGDTPYIIDANNTDRYPLMYPWSSLAVHNINTGLGYAAIQEAIDTNETLGGHVIFVDAGTYYEHVVVYKSLTIIGEINSNTIIDGNGTGTVVYINASNVNISYFTIQNSGGILEQQDSGFFIEEYSYGNILCNNIISNSGYGIYVYSGYNVVTNNTISNSYAGILLDFYDNNNVSGNILTNNTAGLFLKYSGGNNLRNNNMTNNKWNFGVSGTYLEDYDNDIDATNLVDGKSVHYLVNQSNLTIDSSTFPDIGYLGIVNSKNVTVKDLSLTKNGQGVLFAFTSYSTIENVDASNNYIGIHFIDSAGNTVGNNIISNNSIGIYLDGGSNNRIYHNNFINNEYQAGTYESSNVWDNGYPSGGNYWSNYTGVDANMNGIGDTTHEIDADNVDNYPLMGMFSDFKATSEHNVQTICNSSISDFQFNGTAIGFNVTGENDTTGFCRICIPTALMNDTFRVFVNGTEILPSPEPLPCSNSTHNYLYFTYDHSTQEVVIVPEFPTLTSMLLMLIVLTVVIAIYKRRLLKTPIH